VLAGAVLLRAMVPFEPRQRSHLAGIPVLLAAGRSDPIVPPTLVERLGVLLSEGGAAVEIKWSPAGHGLTKGDLEDASTFLARHAADFGISSLTGEAGPAQ